MLYDVVNILLYLSLFCVPVHRRELLKALYTRSTLLGFTFCLGQGPQCTNISHQEQRRIYYAQTPPQARLHRSTLWPRIYLPRLQCHMNKRASVLLASCTGHKFTIMRTCFAEMEIRSDFCQLWIYSCAWKDVRDNCTRRLQLISSPEMGRHNLTGW